MKRILIGVVVVLVLGGIVFASLKSGGTNKGARVYGAEVERRSIARLVKASGEIDPRVKVNISAHVIGKIEKLYVEEGDEIEAGAPFLELEREAFTAGKDSAAAQLAIARSRSRQAVINLHGTLDYFVENPFNYPNLAEAYKIAALDAWNRMPPA